MKVQFKEAMIKRRTLSVIIVLMIILACILIIKIISDANIVEVYVNGEALLASEVDTAVSMNPSASREEIVENSINDMLILQYARSNGITVTDKEVDATLSEFSNTFPELYDLAIKGYGKKQFYRGAKNRLLVSRATDLIIHEYIHNVGVSDQEIIDFIEENGISISDIPRDSYYEIIAEAYLSTQKEIILSNWITEEREKAIIEYPNNER